MSVAALSSTIASSSFQFASIASPSVSLQKGLLSLQQSVKAGDLAAANAAFAKVRQASKALAKSAPVPDTQLSTDIAALGASLGKGDLASGSSALITVQNDVTTGNARAITNAAASANQTVQQLDAILGIVDPGSGSSSIVDLTTAYLSKAYGSDAVPSPASRVNVSA